MAVDKKKKFSRFLQTLNNWTPMKKICLRVFDKIWLLDTSYLQYCNVKKSRIAPLKNVYRDSKIPSVFSCFLWPKTRSASKCLSGISIATLLIYLVDNFKFVLYNCTYYDRINKNLNLNLHGRNRDPALRFRHG